VKYFFFMLALMHAPVSLSAESALPPAQRPAFAPAKRSSKDMGKPGTNNCETPVLAASRAPHVAGGDRFECGRIRLRIGRGERLSKDFALANGA
jgi:hypothetical protein